MDDLTLKVCVACEGGVPPLMPSQVKAYLTQVPEWKTDDLLSITRTFTFKDFKEAMVFTNKVADIAESEGHHPDMTVSWGKVGISLTTHAIGGLSENDFIVAAKIDQL